MSERWTCRLVNQPRGTQRYHLSKLLRNHRFGSAVFGRVAGEPEARLLAGRLGVRHSFASQSFNCRGQAKSLIHVRSMNARKRFDVN